MAFVRAVSHCHLSARSVLGARLLLRSHLRPHSLAAALVRMSEHARRHGSDSNANASAAAANNSNNNNNASSGSSGSDGNDASDDPVCSVCASDGDGLLDECASCGALFCQEHDTDNLIYRINHHANCTGEAQDSCNCLDTRGELLPVCLKCEGAE